MAEKTLAEIFGHLTVEELELDDGDIIADVFVIARIVKASQQFSTTTFTSTVGLQDTATRIGAITMVSDYLRERGRRGWDGDDE